VFENSLNKFLNNSIVWWVISLIVMLWYLSPLLFNNGEFYVPVFDNLDSNVVWYKILAESGMIFADNNAIIPNMMNGLPRSSYPGELNVILWLYYFFEPKLAFVINEVIIHLVAFISMYLFLQKYIVSQKQRNVTLLVFAGSLYFATMPYWSGAGITIAIAPLVTYSLLNIKNRVDTKWDWILLLFLPLYTSFVFFYMFYIIMVGSYILYDAYRSKKINLRFILAVILMGIVFLLCDYRLILSMFVDSSYVSHRVEFDLFYDQPLLTSYRNALVFFLDGHTSHANALQSFYVLPIIILAMLLLFIKRKLNQNESLVVFFLMILFFYFDVWTVVLTSMYTLPTFILGSIMIYVYKPSYRTFALQLFLLLFLSFYIAINDLELLHPITEYVHILKELNILRLAFIQPVIYTILFVLSLWILSKKLKYINIMIVIILILQVIISMQLSFYQSKPQYKYASFEQYYATKLFDRVKSYIDKPINSITVVSYGIEPAVAQYNGFYTIGGYIVNYPLEYKYRFRKVIEDYLDQNKSLETNMAKNLYDKWGSKVYIMSTVSTLHFYHKEVVARNPQFNVDALCMLDTDYILSSRKIDKDEIVLNKYFRGDALSWDIYLYSLDCNR